MRSAKISTSALIHVREERFETGVVRSVCGAVCGRADPTQRRANSTTSIAIAHTFTAIPGRLTSGCGHAGSPLPYGCDVAPRQNVTLASAESICGALDDCVGFSFQSPTATPAGVVQHVYFKGADVDCDHSRFGDGICPYTSDGTWQTFLKDYKPVPRTPVWLRHYNLSVVPPRCGDINIALLFPYDIDNSFIFDYAENTIQQFSSFVLEQGECGKVGPYGNPRALAYTKRSNPASSGTPWLGPDGGGGAGPGAPGYPGTGGYSFQELCFEECDCQTGAGPVPGMGPPCTDENSVGRCVVCSPSFNKKLASNSTLVRLWCDPHRPGLHERRPDSPAEECARPGRLRPGQPHERQVDGPQLDPAHLELDHHREPRRRFLRSVRWDRLRQHRLHQDRHDRPGLQEDRPRRVLPKISGRKVRWGGRHRGRGPVPEGAPLPHRPRGWCRPRLRQLVPFQRVQAGALVLQRCVLFVCFGCDAEMGGAGMWRRPHAAK